MKFVHFCVPVALMVTCLYSTGCMAETGVLAPTQNVSTTATLPAVPDDGLVKTFSSQAQFDFSEDGEDGPVFVSDRILDGFQAAPSRLALADGSSIRWGFKFQEANVQSVVINDGAGQLELLAAVDGISNLTGAAQPIDSIEGYNKAVKASGLDPSVNVFVRHDRDLKTYLPLLKRWLQADLLGMNVDCATPEMQGACKLAEQIAVPIQVHVIGSDGSMRNEAAPAVQASPVPLKDFVQ